MDKAALIEKVIAGKASPEEQRELDEWLLASAANSEEYEDVKRLIEDSDPAEDEPDDAFYDGLRKIQDKINTIRQQRKRARIAKLFIIVLMLLLALYLLFHQLGEWAASRRNWQGHIEERGRDLRSAFNTYEPTGYEAIRSITGPDATNLIFEMLPLQRRSGPLC